MGEPFVIFKVSWLTQRPGEERFRDEIVESFYQVTKFLQDRGLVVRPLMQDRTDIIDEFALSSADLTDEGLAVLKAAYDKWLTKVDNGMPPDDWSVLDKALKKVRELQLR